MLKAGIVIFMLVVALYTVSRKRPLEAILGRTILGTLAVALYAAYKAPDVALAEGLLGVALSTFIYITAFKSLGKIRLGWGVPPDETTQYIQKRLIEYAQAKGYEVELVQYQKIEKALEALEEGYLDALYSFSPLPHRSTVEAFPLDGETTKTVLLFSKKSDLIQVFRGFWCQESEEKP